MGATKLPGRLMDLRTAAVYLGCSYWTLRDLALNGHVPIVRIPSPRARDGRALRRILIDSQDFDLLIERWKEGNRIDASNATRTETGGPRGNAVQTRRRLVDQVLPERRRHAGIVAQHEGVESQEAAEAPRGRHRARPASEPEAESNPVRRGGGRPGDGVRGERAALGRRARAADSVAPDPAFRRPAPGDDHNAGHQHVHPEAPG